MSTMASASAGGGPWQWPDLARAAQVAANFLRSVPEQRVGSLENRAGIAQSSPRTHHDLVTSQRQNGCSAQGFVGNISDRVRQESSVTRAARFNVTSTAPPGLSISRITRSAPSCWDSSSLRFT